MLQPMKNKKETVITLELLKVIYNRAIDESSRVLSKSFKAGAKIESINMNIVRYSDISDCKRSNSDTDSVGSSINIVGDMPIKLLFLVEKDTALLFTDLYLRKQSGSSKVVDDMVKSVMHELGNVIASSVANMVCADLGFAMLPNPPVINCGKESSVICDFLSAGSGSTNRNIYIIETIFNVVRYKLSAKLFIMPEVETFAKLNIDLGV
jgi:chemotaxis protein CheY-P-specific phosphatase CheC